MPLIRHSISGGRPDTRSTRFRRQLALVLAGGLAVHVGAPAIDAQGRSATDRSLSASLLSVSIPGPVAPYTTAVDSGSAAHAVRFEIDYGRVIPGQRIDGLPQVVVLGVRSESEGNRDA